MSVVQQEQVLTVTKPDGSYTTIVPGILTDVFGDCRRPRPRAASRRPSFAGKPAPDTSWLGLILTGLLPLILIGGFLFFMMRQAQGTNNQALSASARAAPGCSWATRPS